MTGPSGRGYEDAVADRLAKEYADKLDQYPTALYEYLCGTLNTEIIPLDVLDQEDWASVKRVVDGVMLLQHMNGVLPRQLTLERATNESGRQ